MYVNRGSDCGISRHSVFISFLCLYYEFLCHSTAMNWTKFPLGFFWFWKRAEYEYILPLKIRKVISILFIGFSECHQNDTHIHHLLWVREIESWSSDVRYILLAWLCTHNNWTLVIRVGTLINYLYSARRYRRNKVYRLCTYLVMLGFLHSLIRLS